MVDDIIQTSPGKKTATISFTVDPPDLDDTKEVVDSLRRALKCRVLIEDHLAKVSVVGLGMRVHTGVAERMFAAMAKAGINIENITTSEIKISCLINRSQGKKALRVVHDAFDLGPKKTKAARKRTSRK